MVLEDRLVSRIYIKGEGHVDEAGTGIIEHNRSRDVDVVNLPPGRKVGIPYRREVVELFEPVTGLCQLRLCIDQFLVLRFELRVMDPEFVQGGEEVVTAVRCLDNMIFGHAPS